MKKGNHPSRSDTGEREFIRKLALAFDSLEPECRAALWLHFREKDDIVEVAHSLDIEPEQAEAMVEESLGRLEAWLLRRGIPWPGDEIFTRLLRALPLPRPSPGFLPRLLLLRNALPEGDGA